MSMAIATPKSQPVLPRTVLVLGASYAGHRAAQLLASTLPSGWRVVVIERNTHFNHLYAFPRVAVLPGHEHKTFIPYTNMFSNAPIVAGQHPHVLIHATVMALGPHSVTYRSLDTGQEDSLSFEYLIYGLGSHLPAPINVWATEKEESNCPAAPGTPLGTPTTIAPPKLRLPPRGTKVEGTKFMRKEQAQILAANSVLVIGGGPLGIQYASDIKDLYPTKEVTLVHSREQLLPRFDEYLHYAAVKKLEELGIRVILRSRVDLSSVHAGVIDKSRQLEVSNGEKVGAELVLVCTGQTPNTSFLASFAPESINPLNGAAYVTRSMQLADPPILPPSPSPSSLELPPGSPPMSDVGSDEEDDYFREEEEEDELTDDYSPKIASYPHIFVVGDASDAFGALKAGHTAWGQAEVAAANVITLIIREDAEPSDEEVTPSELQQYFPPPYLIKVSLGFKHAVFQSRDLCGTKGEQDCKDEALNSHVMWTRRGLSTEDMTI